ncbi:MAG: DUF2382 domain-containing protein [Cyanobacteria bacterium P01_G01_bin.67]
MTLSNDQRDPVYSSEVYQLSLLEEKLQIARRQQKVGEVIIRKVVETRVVNIPIRREKLIVEKVSENPQKLTEVVLSSEKVNGFEYDEVKDNDSFYNSKSHFLSLSAAQNLLALIDQLTLAANAKIRLEIVSSCLEDQIKLNDICDHDR